MARNILGIAAALICLAPLAAALESDACTVLAKAGLSKQLYFSGDDAYVSTIESYYSADVQDVTPLCILQPETTKQLAKAIQVLSSRLGGSHREDVAIRSGGHAPYPSNNIESGVTIDLGRMDSVTYTPSRSCNGLKGIASVGSGARWGNVYATLEAKGVMVTGGREGHVGVGGFLLGGGFSWYSGKVGMSADNVVSYEVVLADGSIVTASAKSHTSLFKALKGGMNNLGVVTRFDLQAFPAHDVYGGILAYPYSQRFTILKRFVDMINRNSDNPAEGGFVSYSWTPGSDPNVAFITANVDGDTNSTSFTDLATLGPLVDYRATQPLTGLVTMIQSTLGLYNIWFTLSFQNTEDMGRKVLEVFDATIAELETKLDEAVNVIFLFTPLPKSYGQHGDNILGLDGIKNSIVFQGEALLPSAKYEALVTEKLRAATAKIEKYAKATGQNTPWRYVNYANPEQDPLGSYGAANLKYLKTVAKVYDTKGFFQTGVPGGFKAF